MPVRHWSTSFLRDSGQGADSEVGRRALIILNQPFSSPLLLRVWKVCQWRACADGGANRLYDTLQANPGLDSDAFIPDLIKGDLDSLRSDVADHFRQLGVSIIKDPDQYSTDLMKCVSAIEQLEAATPGRAQFTIVILGGLSGRFDQTIHTVSYLHKLRKVRKEIFVVTDENIGWYLDEGEHIIKIDRSLIGPTCGLLPVGIDSAIISTRGLQWNLDNAETSFNGMVSSSNSVKDEEVFVSTTKPIFWSIELAFL
ncbi:Thiamin pyrophosphokinase [Fomitiporia mediterranea MF3/22]|uniref:Thiamin pyrophosphokinase n=1 Tax=Fomitiporia mediterranea (strain MF3/22) TaxID=694068 RepID=UPI0004407565|nr:Thiamin pyrophosphokinase [Fomitiporia mediterranea MF3/22]EJD06394.1 Thiamin pyrophosphokinase [Fomitiporia mediterranea MF3/22]